MSKKRAATVDIAFLTSPIGALGGEGLPPVEMLSGGATITMNRPASTAAVDGTKASPKKFPAKVMNTPTMRVDQKIGGGQG